MTDVTVTGSGKCACGRISFRVYGEPIWTAGCCCRDCARATGTPYVVWVGFSTDAVRFENSKPTLAETSEGVLRGYCEKCGSSLTYGRTEEYDTTDRLLYISAATLDDPNRFPPTEVVWYSQRPEWFELVQTIPLHDGVSPDQSDRAYNSAKQRQ